MQFPLQYDEQVALGQTIDTTLNEFRGVLNIRISTIDEVITRRSDGGPGAIRTHDPLESCQRT